MNSTSQDGFQYSQAILVENHVFLSEVRLVEEQGVAGSLGKGGVSLGAAEVCKCWFIDRYFLCSTWLICLLCRAPFAVSDWREPLLCFLALLPSQSDQEQKVHSANVARHSTAVPGAGLGGRLKS